MAYTRCSVSAISELYRGNNNEIDKKKITYAIRFYWYTFILLRLRVFVIIIPVIVLL